ncbi:24723_t:CDS:1, partial [Racocetra persica]
NETLLKELDSLVEDIILPFQDSKTSTKDNSNKNTYDEIENSEDQMQECLDNSKEILVKDFENAVHQLSKFNVKE